MSVRRLGVGTLGFLAVFVTILAASADTGDKQLARVKGVVGYQVGDNGSFKAIFGRLDLPDDAYAITRADGSAVLRMADSSEIDIGSNTKVQVGAFNAASTGNANTIVLQNGALHFNIRHPQGGQSNYKFVTATSQIAVRGTEAFLVNGPAGTQAACVSCAAGDVTVTAGGQSFPLLTGQTVTVLSTGVGTVSTTIVSNSAINNPSINGLNGNQNPFNPNPSSPSLDPTGSAAGTGGAAGGISGGTAAAIGGGAAAAGAVVAVTNKGNKTVPPPGPLEVQVNFPGASSVFPLPFSWPFAQQNATGDASATCAPGTVITCTVNQSSLGNGNIVGTLNAPGTFTLTASASGYTLPLTTFHIYGAVQASPASLQFTNSIPQTISVTQLPTGTALTSSVSCVSGAGISVTPSSGPSPLLMSVVPTSVPPATSQTAACTLTVVGGGGAAASSVAIPVNISTTSLNITSHIRKPL